MNDWFVGFAAGLLKQLGTYENQAKICKVKIQGTHTQNPTMSHNQAMGRLRQDVYDCMKTGKATSNII